jgi:hypothetical protein
MSADCLSPASGCIAKARRVPSGLIAGSTSLSGPEVIATKRTDEGDGLSGAGREARTKTTAPTTAASVIEAADEDPICLAAWLVTV